MSSAKDNGNLMGGVEGRMRRLTRRDLQLWLIALLVLLVIVSGVVALALPNLSWNGASLKVEARYLPQVLLGLIGIVILFNVYVLQQRRELNQARDRLIGELLERERDESLAMVDPLTQLFNQRYVEQILPKEVYRAKRRGSGFSLVLVGVEETRRTLRRAGGAVGQQCLVDLARMMESTFRLSDTVVRYGAERFLVLMPDTVEKQAEVAVERLLNQVDALNEKGVNPYRVVMHWGIASYKEGVDVSDILHVAEESLRKEKRQQRRGQVLRMETCPQALLVTSDRQVLAMLRPILDSLEIGVELSTQEEGLRVLEGRKFDALLVDCSGKENDLELLRRIRGSARVRRMLVVAIASPEQSEAAYRLGANFVLAKPLAAEVACRILRVVHGLMVGEEQRFFRYAVDTTVHMNFGQALVQAPVSHLSEGGMVVRSAMPLELNRTTTLRFKLPNLTTPLEVQGEIAWISPDGRAGIRFVRMPLASRHLLQRWLASASPAGEAGTTPAPSAAISRASLSTAVATQAAQDAQHEVTRQAMLVPTAN